MYLFFFPLLFLSVGHLPTYPWSIPLPLSSSSSSSSSSIASLILLFHSLLYLRIAPASSVMVSSISPLSSPPSFTISWQELECADVNDEAVQQYTIRYRPVGSTDYQMIDVGAPSTAHVIMDSDFPAFKTYSFEVAARNSVGMSSYGLPMKAAIVEGV